MSLESGHAPRVSGVGLRVGVAWTLLGSALALLVGLAAADVRAEPPANSLLLLGEVLGGGNHRSTPGGELDGGDQFELRYLHVLGKRISLGAQLGRCRYRQTIPISRSPDVERRWGITRAGISFRVDLFPGTRIRPYGVVNAGAARIVYDESDDYYASPPRDEPDGTVFDAELGAGVDVLFGKHLLVGCEVGHVWTGPEIRDGGVRLLLGVAW